MENQAQINMYITVKGAFQRNALFMNKKKAKEQV